MIKLKDYSGILFIGDPHLWSKKPAKRLDDSFMNTVLAKIKESFLIAKKQNLYPIILGDLFHVDSESDIFMLTQLVRLLKINRDPCSTVEGNHEKSQLELSDDVALTLLKESDLIYVLDKNSFQIDITIEGKKVLIGSSPYGSSIPKSVTPPKNINPDFTFWLTHHNLDFGDSYPGVTEVLEIEGVDVLVNGHIHKSKKKISFDKMVAFNPGNIVRLSTDCSDHEPAVWKWTPSEPKELTMIPLTYKKDVFDLTGNLISQTESDPKKIVDITPVHSSQFVNQMQIQLNSGVDLSDDGGHIKESIVALGKAMDIESSIVDELLKIADDTIKEIE